MRAHGRRSARKRAVAGILLVTVATFLFPPEIAGAATAAHDCSIPAHMSSVGALPGPSIPCSHPDGQGCVLAVGCMSLPAVLTSIGIAISAPAVRAARGASGPILGPALLRAGPPTPPPNS